MLYISMACNCFMSTIKPSLLTVHFLEQICKRSVKKIQFCLQVFQSCTLTCQVYVAKAILLRIQSLLIYSTLQLSIRVITNSNRFLNKTLSLSLQSDQKKLFLIGCKGLLHFFHHHCPLHCCKWKWLCHCEWMMCMFTIQ